MIRAAAARCVVAGAVFAAIVTEIRIREFRDNSVSLPASADTFPFYPIVAPLWGSSQLPPLPPDNDDPRKMPVADSLRVPALIGLHP